MDLNPWEKTNPFLAQQRTMAQRLQSIRNIGHELVLGRVTREF
jgi:hypothetical protein